VVTRSHNEERAEGVSKSIKKEEKGPELKLLMSCELYGCLLCCGVQLWCIPLFCKRSDVVLSLV